MSLAVLPHTHTYCNFFFLHFFRCLYTFVIIGHIHFITLLTVRFQECYNSILVSPASSIVQRQLANIPWSEFTKFALLKRILQFCLFFKLRMQCKYTNCHEILICCTICGHHLHTFKFLYLFGQEYCTENNGMLCLTYMCKFHRMISLSALWK